MDREELKDQILHLEPTFLQQAKNISGKPSYVCPACGNGSGNDRTGISMDRHTASHPRYKCFKCGLYEDIIGLWKAQHHESDDRQAFKELYRYYGIDDGSDDFHLSANKLKTHPKVRVTQPVQEEQEDDVTQYCRTCTTRLGQTNYLSKRGISNQTAIGAGIGYDPNFGKSHWKAIIIPTSAKSFVARNTDMTATKSNRYRKHGHSRMFNLSALREPSKRPVVICEGEIDALSIMEAGGLAIGIGSASNARQFAQYLLKHGTQKTIVLAMDHDKAGEQARDYLYNTLTTHQINVQVATFFNDYNDVNDMLVQNRKAFIKGIKKLNAQFVHDTDEAKKRPNNLTSTADCIKQFMAEIKASKPPISTGFDHLDHILDGGLYPGLYMIGAMSSIGKTTYLIQMADQIAKQGQDVLLFSIEMSQAEIMAKSISRLTVEKVLDPSSQYQRGDAKTMHEILNGAWYASYSKRERYLIAAAVQAYKQFADHLYIIETANAFTLQDMVKTVNDFIEQTGSHPVVMIDYLQLLSVGKNMTDKQSMDTAIRVLKQLSRSAHIPIIAISSFNRSSYHSEAAMDSFKESGGIEYGSDVLIGMQIDSEQLAYYHDDLNQAKAQIPRKVELIVLKSRNSAAGQRIRYNYYPQYNFFNWAK